MGFGEGGVRLWTGLEDTPNSYAGQAGKVPIVKATEDGLRLGTLDYTSILADWEHRFYIGEGTQLEHWLEAVSGSGTTEWTNHRLLVASGTVAGSWANRRCEIPYGNNASLHKINYNYPVWCQIEGQFYRGGAAIPDRYAFLGIDKGTNDATDLSNMGMGIRFSRNGLKSYAQCHNDVDLTSVEMAWSQYDGRVIMRMIFTPGESVKFFCWNGSTFELLATLTTNLPTGDETGKIQVAANNNIGTTNMEGELTKAMLYHHY